MFINRLITFELFKAEQLWPVLLYSILICCQFWDSGLFVAVDLKTTDLIMT